MKTLRAARCRGGQVVVAHGDHRQAARGGRQRRAVDRVRQLLDGRGLGNALATHGLGQLGHLTRLDGHVGVGAEHRDLDLVSAHESAPGRRDRREGVLRHADQLVVVLAGHAQHEAPLNRRSERGGNRVGAVSRDHDVHAHLASVARDLREGGEPGRVPAELVLLAERADAVDQNDDAGLLGRSGDAPVFADASGANRGIPGRAVVDRVAQHPQQADDALLVVAVDDRAHVGQLLEHAESARSEVEAVDVQRAPLEA